MKRHVFLNICSIFSSAFLWLISIKLVSYWLGPEGVGLFSQFRQIIQSATIGATYGGTNAVVQGISERKDSALSVIQFRGTACRLIGITTGVLVICLLSFTDALTHYLFSSDKPDLITTFQLLIIAILLNVGSTYASAVLNGYRLYGYLVFSQISGPLVLVTALFIVYQSNLDFHPQILALLLLVCFLASYLAGVFGVLHLPKIITDSTTPKTLTQQDSIRFFKFSGALLISAAASSISLLLIRAWIIDSQGLATAGLFDAAWTLTFNYTTLFLTACSNIYLPLLASTDQENQQKIYLLKTAYLVLAGSTIACYLIVSCKTPLLYLLYNEQFKDAEQIVIILALAVMLRGISWVYGMLIVALKKSNVLMLSDLIFNLILLISADYLIHNYINLALLGWIFVLPHFLYLLFVMEYARLTNHLLKRRYIWPLLLIALLPLTLVAIDEAGVTMFFSHTWILFFSIGIVVCTLTWYYYKKINL